jgi:hypothetical protein
MQRFGALQNRPEKGIVQVTSPYMAVDDRTFEVIGLHGALKFISRGVRVGSRERRKPGETGWMATDRLREKIVDLARKWDGLGDVELFSAWSGQRENLDIDSSSIHVSDAAFIKIAEELWYPAHAYLGSLGALFQRAPRTIQKNWRRVMLFDGDGSHRLRLL